MLRKTSIQLLKNTLDSANIGSPTISGRGIRAHRGRKARHAQATSNRGAHKQGLSPDNFFVVVPVLLVGTGIIWLFFAVVFGGFGGHLFSSLSKAKFLIGSTHKYHETHEAMLAEQKLYKKKSREWAAANDPNNAANKNTSAYKDLKSGTIIYQEEVELRITQAELESELRKAEESGIIAKLKANETKRNLKELVNGEESEDSLTREEVIALLEKQKGQLELVKKGEYERNQTRADSDKDLQTETHRKNTDKDDKAKKAKKAAKTNSSVAEKKSKTSVNTTFANRVRIDFLEDNCSTLNNDSKSIRVEYRKGSAAIKGSSLDDIDGLIKIARACGETRISVSPTEEGVIEDKETDRDLAALRNSEVKYYLLMRRVPKDNIVLFDTLN